MASGKAPYYKQNRLKQLRAFCHAAQAGSITEAAETLFLSQPSVTLQIQALERELGVTVFERRGPKISLTPEGEVLYQLSSPLVDGIDKLQETFLAHMGNLETGELNIAAGESTILYILPEMTKRFANDYPGIRLKLHNVTGRDGLAMIRADDVDFAVGSMLEVPDDINYEPFVSYEPVLITPVSHPLAARKRIQLKDIPPRHLSTWRIVDLVFSQHDLELKVALEAGGWEVIKTYVELGLGISIVTDVCLTGTEKLECRLLSDYFPTRSYGIVTRRGKFLSPAAACYLDMLRDHYLKEGARPLDA